METQRSRPIEQNFRCLEGLRGYMAWCVVMSHAIGQTETGRDIPRFLLHFVYGAKAVNEFIILSGFVIAHLLLAKAEPYQPYLIRRGFRIIPIYLVCLLISVLVVPVTAAVKAAIGAPLLADALQDWATVAANPWPYFWLHLTLMHGVIPDTVLPASSVAFLGPAWSLSLEWQFYLVAPFIVWLLRKSLVSQIVTTLVLLGAYFVFTSGYFGQWRYPSMLFLAIHFFLIGILSRLWLDALGKAPLWIGPVLMAALACALPTLRWELAIWTVFFTAVIHERFTLPLPAVLKLALEWLTANPIITRLGRVSYSTYLIHLSIFSIVATLGNKVFGIHSRAEGIELMALAVILVIPASFLLYWLIEQPFIRMGRRFAAGKPAAIASEAA